MPWQQNGQALETSPGFFCHFWQAVDWGARAAKGQVSGIFSMNKTDTNSWFKPWPTYLPWFPIFWRSPTTNLWVRVTFSQCPKGQKNCKQQRVGTVLTTGCLLSYNRLLWSMLILDIGNQGFKNMTNPNNAHRLGGNPSKLPYIYVCVSVISQKEPWRI